jgi:putative oxidoreductase
MFEGTKRAYHWIISFANSLQPLFLLLVRVFWGWQFFTGGWSKLQNIASIAGFFDNLNIPFPWFTAYLVGGVEFVGGLCLLLGFASRLAAIPLIITMVVAIFLAHPMSLAEIAKDPVELVQAVPFTFLLACLIVFVFGPGAVSIDGLIKRLSKG